MVVLILAEHLSQHVHLLLAHFHAVLLDDVFDHLFVEVAISLDVCIDKAKAENITQVLLLDIHAHLLVKFSAVSWQV